MWVLYVVAGAVVVYLISHILWQLWEFRNKPAPR